MGSAIANRRGAWQPAVGGCGRAFRAAAMCAAVMAWAAAPLFAAVRGEVASGGDAAAIRSVAAWKAVDQAAADRHPVVSIEGVLVARDPAGGWVSIRDATGVLRQRMDLHRGCPAVGSLVRLEGVASAITRYPDWPTEESVEPALAAPSRPGYPHTVRYRGFLIPQVTGDYTFWISSDDRAELWLGTNADPAGKVKIARADDASGAEEWDRSPAQRSPRLHLEGGRPLYLEALQFNGTASGRLKVAWQPPGLDRVVIGGSALTPWRSGADDPADPDDPAVGRPPGILREEWSELQVRSTDDAPERRPSIDGKPRISRPRLVFLGVDSHGEPRRLSPEDPVTPELDGRWSEMEGIVTQVSTLGSQSALEISQDFHRAKIYVENDSDLALHAYAGGRVVVRGYLEGLLNDQGAPTAGALWTTGTNDVQRLGGDASSWGRIPPTAFADCFAKRGRELAGAQVRVRGVLTRLAGGAPALADLNSRVSAAWSEDSNHWTTIGETTLPLPETVHFGLALTAHDANEPASAQFSDPEGWTSTWQSRDIGLARSKDHDLWVDGKLKMTSRGEDIWGDVQEFRYVFAPFAGEHSASILVESLKASSPWAKAGILLRDSLTPDGRYAMVAVTPDEGVVFQHRAAAVGPSARSIAVHGRAPAWLRLTRARRELRVTFADGGAAPRYGEKAEVRGIFQWNADGPQITDAVAVSMAEAVSGGGFGAGSELLTTVDQVRAMSLGEFDPPAPLKVKGVLTAWSDDFWVVQSGRAGVFVSAKGSLGRTARQGDLVQIEGRAESGRGSVVIIPNTIQSLGPGRMPEPSHPSWDRLASGAEDCQWVEIKAAVLAVGGRAMTLMTKGGVFTAVVQGGVSADRPWVGALVRVRGVCEARGDEVPGFQIQVPSADCVGVDRPARRDPYETPVTSISAAIQGSQGLDAPQWARVTGFVTYADDAGFFLQDSSGTLGVASGEPRRSRVGEFVDVVGFLAPARMVAEMAMAGVRPAAGPSGPMPAPERLREGEFPGLHHHGRIVTMDGMVIATTHVPPSGGVVPLSRRGRPFRAALVSGGARGMDFREGSTVQFTGLCRLVGVEGGFAVPADAGVEVTTDGPGGVEVLYRPFWPDRKRRASVVGSVLGILALCAAWIWAGARKNRQLRRAQAALTAAHSDLERRVQERTAALDLVNGELQRKSRLIAEALEQAKAARVEAERANDAKSDFLATMTHEIRTPLNGVVGISDLLLETALNVEQREYAATLKNCSESLLSVVNDILDFSKIEAGKIDLERIEFELLETVENAVEMVAERAAAKRIEVLCRVARDIPAVLLGDPGRIRQVLLNLVGNGVKFTSAGEVVVDVQALRQDAGSVLIEVAVRDTGVGISPEGIRRLFAAYAQAEASTSRRYGGTGLGLSISRRLVEMMGGEMRVESKLGEGSVFRFTLRLEKSAAAPVEPKPPEWPEGPSVLVVDDNAACRGIVLEHLASWKLRGAAAADAVEAIAMLQAAAQANEPFDAALIDCQMPGMNGPGLARAIRGIPSIASTRVVLMATVGDRSAGSGARQGHAGVWLAKPVKRRALFAVLTSLDGDGPVIPSAPAGETSRSDASPAQSLRILVAEDNLVNQGLAAKRLTKLGHAVEIAANGIEALEFLERERFDVVLMDCKMPGMDGFETARRIRALPDDRRHIPIIAMTASAVAEVREECLRAGMNDYVSKPVRTDDLVARLARVTAETPEYADAGY